MFNKRFESFRHVFGKPMEILVQYMQEERLQEIYGLLLEVSPKGIKFFSEKELAVESSAITSEFAINHERMISHAEIVWKQEQAAGWIYGARLTNDGISQILVIEEIKKHIEMISG